MDLKFKADAKVIIISSVLCSHDEVKQMLGRGQRALGKCAGWLYVTKDPFEETAILNKALTPVDFPFRDGAVVLTDVEYLLEKSNNQKQK